MPRQRAYENRNLARGLCSVCPRKRDKDSSRFCTGHLKKNRKNQQRFQKRQFGKVK